MATFPTGKRSDFLLWAQVHAPVWEANAADIGLSPGQAAAFGVAVLKLADVELELEQARQAYLTAAARAQGVYRATVREAGERVRLIRAYGGSQKNPLHVYNTAQIAPPAAKSKAPPPAQPARLAATLGASDGSLTLTWKCSNPAGTSGTSYIVRRRIRGASPPPLNGKGWGTQSAALGVSPVGLSPPPLNGKGWGTQPDGVGAPRSESEFTILGIVGKKTFVDTTLPAGVESVEYTVQGQRASAKGAISPILFVQIGRSARANPTSASRSASRSAAAIPAAAFPPAPSPALHRGGNF